MDQWTIVTLKDALRKRNLKLTGNKADLYARLMGAQATPAVTPAVTPAANENFILLASPGDRHEDMIPRGLYTFNGLPAILRRFLTEETGYYHLFVMKPDQAWGGRGDSDVNISWGEATPADTVIVDEMTPMTFDQLIAHLRTLRK